MNHRNKNINIFSDIRKGYSESFNQLTYNSLITNGATTTYQDRSNYWNPVSNWFSYKVGLDYNLGKNTLLGFLVKANDDKSIAETDNETIFKNASLQKIQSIHTTKTDDQKTISRSYNVNFKQTLDSIGSEWSADADYINYKRRALDIGLRAEHTTYKGTSTTLNLTNDSSYLSLFPSAFFTYKLNEGNTLNASYSRRINRPSYQSLNPFISYIDPFTQFEGNPNLKPSFTQSFEVKHSFKNFLYSTLSYSYTKGQTTNVILQDKLNGAVRNITANVGNSSYLSLNESASFTPVKWWSIDNSVSFNTGKNSSTYPGYEFDQAFYSMDYSVENSFQISKTVKAQLSGYYSTPYKDGITRVRAMYGASAGLQKTLWKNKGSLKLNYNNFVGPNAYRAQYLSDNLNIKWINQWEGKRVNLSFNYKFGNKNVKSARQRNAAAGAEVNRVSL